MTINKSMNISIALGTTFAWYDFIIFNIAVALIFPLLFFPDMGYLIPILVFSVGFLARPIGSLIFGMIGDRFGRKVSLTYTLYITGLSTVMIGLLPTYEDIGIASTIILIIARILQTLAFGGEWSAAGTMILEHHSDHPNKGLMASLVPSGWPIATVLASAMFMLATSFGNEFFIAYGWRIPFLLSVFLLLIGVYIRHRALESPLFEITIQKNKRDAFDLIYFFKIFKKNILVGAAAFQLSAAWAYMIMIFGFGYVLQNNLITRADLTQLQFALSWILLVGILFWGWLGDKIGCKNVFYIGIATSLALTLPVFLWLEQGNIALAYACLVFLNCPAFACAPKLFCDQFPTRFRQTGSGVTFNLGVMLGAGLVPLIAQQILVATDNLMYVAGLMFLLTLLSLVTTFSIKKINEYAA